MRHPQQALVLVLRTMGCLDLAALIAVAMPGDWLEIAHRWAGLDTFPAEPIAGYLARSASAMYALHGALLVFISKDVERYAPLIRFLGYAAVIHGSVMLAIDIAMQMPIYWQIAEGPCFAGLGGIVLWLQAKVRPAR
ncbi:MAG: hypothetical protein JSS02_16040 [Planctomycetes bacterium]|nr:hypothetical protein [Planctomycetota bacterium]